QPPRVQGRGDTNGLAVNPDGAGVGPVGAAKNLDEGALPRAIFPEQREHFTCEEIKSPVLDRAHAGKRFLDPDHFQQRCAGGRHLSDGSFAASALRKRAVGIRTCFGTSSPFMYWINARTASAPILSGNWIGSA